MRNLKRRLREWRIAWIVAPSVTGFVLLLRSISFFQAPELSMFDRFVQLRPIEPVDQRIAIVSIDDIDVPECCFVPSKDMQTLITKIEAMHPKVIGQSVPLYLMGDRGWDELNKYIAAQPNLVQVGKVFSKELKSSKLKVIGGTNTQQGLSNLIADPDNRVRRGLLYLSKPSGQSFYSLSLNLAKLYLAPQGIDVQPIDRDRFQFGKTTFQQFTHDHGGYAQIEHEGFEVLMNYSRFDQNFDTVSMTAVMKDRVPPEWGRDRIIIIGTVNDGFQNLSLTPFSSELKDRPTLVPKAEIYAHLTSQLLNAALDGRSPLKSWSEPIEVLWVLFWALVGAHLSFWRWRHLPNRKSFLYLLFLGVVLLTISAIFYSGYVAILMGWWIPVIPPLVAGIMSGVGITGYFAFNASKVRHTFGRYLSDEVVANLLESKEGLKLGGERRTITMLVSDLRGFTATSEHLPPEEVVRVINIYLEAMAEVITAYQGTIDEFMGDGILVLFGAPTIREDDAERAVACAVSMQLAMPRVNAKVTALGLDRLEMGIGVNTGEVVVGNIGSEKRAKYGIVGNQVNLTYRMESYTVGGQILIAERTFQAVRSIALINSSREIQSKGLQHPITIYDVAGIGGKFNLYLPQTTETYLPLPTEISIEQIP